MSDPADALRRQFASANTFHDLDDLVERMKKGDIQGPILFDEAGGDATGLRPIQPAPTEVRHTVSESADKIVLKTKIKRGEGTRDEDRIEVKVKDDDPDSAAQKLHDTVVAIGERNTVNALRGTQPSGENDA